ncbi:MAG: S-layer protein [Planctomycetaceae bacterium]|nr:S-layer protein [Planctomycetaceae bacterium]
MTQRHVTQPSSFNRKPEACASVRHSRSARLRLAVKRGIATLLLICGTALTLNAASPNFPGLGAPGDLTAIEYEQAGEPVLRGKNARRQLVVTGKYSSGQSHDLSHSVAYSVDNPGILQVDETGLVTPLSDGEATITARDASGKETQLKLTVDRCNEQLPVNFKNEIVPIFTKLGCNTGTCHGKSDGQNGFKLSLLGFYPDDDYDYLVKEDRGRRIFHADPEYSLLLTKSSNKLPHGGGHRLAPGSYEWQLITSWIEQGTPYGEEDDPTIDRIEVFPKTRTMNADTKQQLIVIAHYSDGTTRDITRIATYGSNDAKMAASTTTGLVTTLDIPGDVATMVRFQSQVAVFRANIPLGVEVNSLPPERTLVDKHIFAKLKKLGIPPSELCDDATFIRRTASDIAGRLPTGEEARTFIEDKDPNKRDKLIDDLLNSPGYAGYFANKWANVLRNRRVNNNDIPYTFRFHAWIRRAFQKNMPYDHFVRNVLAASGDPESHPPSAWFKVVSTSTAQMEDTSQLFLGLRIQCARCHHHPFEKWSQNDYYGFEAFFKQVGLKQSKFALNNVRDFVYHRGGAAVSQNPRTGENLKPTGLGGEPLDIPAYEDPRHHLVDWMSAPDNPFFARALANRYWKHFFGRGIVDPEDDMRVTNPPSNPELLDALADQFIKSKFDLKDLIRQICRSSTYQLSSEANEYNGRDEQNFSSFYPRRLNAESLYDAINQVAGVPARFNGVPVGTRATQLPDNGFNDYFLQVFGKPEAQSACECERSAEANLAQSLHLLNSTDIQGRLSNGNGRARQLVQNEELTDAQKVTELYYWGYSRPPRDEELKFVLSYIEPNENKQQAYEDLLWAIFNTKEFLFVR